jgi:hypothetical protein
MIEEIIKIEWDSLKSKELEYLINVYEQKEGNLLNVVYKLYDEYFNIEIDNKVSLLNALQKYKRALDAFSKINKAFYNKYSKEKDLSKKSIIHTYFESSAIHINNLQNSYISPITFKIHQLDYKNIQEKAEESVKQGESLISDSIKSTHFAKRTFYIALFISIISFIVSAASLVIGINSNGSNEEVVFQNKVNIDSIKTNISNLKNDMIQYDSLCSQYEYIKSKLDSIYKIEIKKEFKIKGESGNKRKDE